MRRPASSILLEPRLWDCRLHDGKCGKLVGAGQVSVALEFDAANVHGRNQIRPARVADLKSARVVRNTTLL